MTPKQTARQKFTLGQRVRESAAYPRTYATRGGSIGIVVGFGREDHIVRVRRVTSTQTGSLGQSYSMNYWEPIEEDPTP